MAGKVYILMPIDGICDEHDCVTKYPGPGDTKGETRIIPNETCGAASDCFCADPMACNYGLMEECVFCSDGLGEYCDLLTKCCALYTCNDPTAENFRAVCGPFDRYEPCIYCDDYNEMYHAEICMCVTVPRPCCEHTPTSAPPGSTCSNDSVLCPAAFLPEHLDSCCLCEDPP